MTLPLGAAILLSKLHMLNNLEEVRGTLHPFSIAFYLLLVYLVLLVLKY